MGTQNTPEEPHLPDARQDLPNPEAALGGADDVEKTTYVTGKGTDPSGSNRKGEPSARVGGGGMGIGGWVLIAAVVGIAVLFGGSLLR